MIWLASMIFNIFLDWLGCLIVKLSSNGTILIFFSVPAVLLQAILFSVTMVLSAEVVSAYYYHSCCN